MSAVKASPELVGLGQDGKGQERFTSREMIAVEQRLERAADRLAERGGHGLPAAAVRGVAATGSDSLVLGTQQEAALAHITSRRSEEHTSELQSLMRISYAIFCLQNKKTAHTLNNIYQ